MTGRSPRHRQKKVDTDRSFGLVELTGYFKHDSYAATSVVGSEDRFETVVLVLV